MKYVDLFCGMGSFTYSFDKLGYECVLACDINDVARQTFEHNFHLRPHCDIQDLQPDAVPDHDVLCAGFPCQPFSNAGCHNGFEDARGTMFFHVLNIVRAKQPSFVVLENVPALRTHDEGKTFETILACLKEASYTVEHQILKCCEYGIPQLRKRLFLVAYRNDLAPSLHLPVLATETYKSTVTLADYLQAPYQRTVAYTIRCGGRGSGLGNKHNWDTYLVDQQVHRLTLQEAKKLQGFDDSYELTGPVTQQWRLLGNTIPTVFTRIIGERLLAVTKGVCDQFLNTDPDPYYRRDPIVP